jgi:hypothetical protein
MIDWCSYFSNLDLKYNKGIKGHTANAIRLQADSRNDTSRTCASKHHRSLPTGEHIESICAVLMRQK